MRIGIPVDSSAELAEEYSSAGIFAIYDVHDETRAVAYLGRQELQDPGCGKTPGFLRGHGVEVVLAHQISVNAVNHLLEAGIVAIQDAPRLTADALIAHLVSGTLQARPPEVAMHEGGCNSGGGGGCGHCCGGGGAHGHEQDHAHEHGHDHGPEAAGKSCADHSCQQPGCQ